MTARLPFRYLEPVFYAGLFDDPVLLVHLRPLGKSFLFDCGQLHHLAKRVLKSVAAVFVTHCHMDHFMGLDTLIRNVHVSPQTVELFGPPGFAAKVCHKFAAYDWNLTEPCWCTFRASDVHADFLTSCLLPGPQGFPPLPDGDSPRPSSTLLENQLVRVEAVTCDHKISSLAFRISEQPVFAIDETRLNAAGLVKGAWIDLLKTRLFRKEPGEPLRVLRRERDRVREDPVFDPARLYGEISLHQDPASIGYLTDVGFTPDNLEKLVGLLSGVTLLIAECSFLGADRERARASHHLCTSDLNLLVDRIRPRWLLPMHLSKSYAGRSRELYAELELPEGVTLLHLPDRLTPRPLLMEEAIGLRRP